jgi:hypothetical protein
MKAFLPWRSAFNRIINLLVKSEEKMELPESLKEEGLIISESQICNGHDHG